LNIGIFTIKDFLKPVYCQLFCLIHDFTTSIIATAGIALCIFIGHHIAHGLHDLDGSKIFGSDQFNTVSLAFKFFMDEVKNDLVSLHGANLGQQ
jgi:hypothetical protein